MSKTLTVTDDKKDFILRDESMSETFSVSESSSKIPDLEVWYDVRGITELICILERHEVNALMRFFADWLDRTP